MALCSFSFLYRGGVKDVRTLHRIRRVGALHRAGGSGPARHRFLFSPPQRGVRCPVVSLLARGNAEARMAAFSRAKKHAKVDHVPHDLHCRHRRKTGSHASGVSLPMKGTDAFGCIALFAPENTEHAGALSAPAVRERCSCMDGPSPMRPVAGLALTAATPWNRCRKAAPHDSA
ncbi:hypothetical protein CBM2609_A100088 [Cupriavidus taiwanensis]|nr:hypothetical protein CBM2609_A100088 [Cupriavidus taiwanensis]SOZ41728.1 hypothetical protein CBM2610_A100086 [Cupriavidus taiwanensis]